ncbi:MAG: hypothetical protein ACRC8G_09005 [Plesiomonas shigelloides]
MKELTEAQVTGFRRFALPPSRRSAAEREPSAAEKREGRRKTATRRAIEEYHEKLAERLAMEI